MIAAVLGVEVETVAIHEDGTGLTTMAPLTSRERGDLEPRILIALAGSLAMARRTRWGAVLCTLNGGQGDAELVDELLAEARACGWGNAPTHDWNRYTAEARELVRHHWASIERVATALLDERALTGERVRALVA